MQVAAKRLCPILEHDFNISLRIGIGIHFGTVILGRIGHPGKRQMTVIGDTVNTDSPHFSRCLIECWGGLTSTAPQPTAVIWA
jgi:hypothetical protein